MNGTRYMNVLVVTAEAGVDATIKPGVCVCVYMFRILKVPATASLRSAADLFRSISILACGFHRGWFFVFFCSLCWFVSSVNTFEYFSDQRNRPKRPTA